MKNQCKKLITLVLAFALVLTSVAYQPTAARAADITTLLDETGVATANTAITKVLNVTALSEFMVEIYVPAPVAATVEVKSSADNAVIYNRALTENDWLPTETGTTYLYSFVGAIQIADVYTITIIFASDTEYQFVAVEALKPYISSSALTLTVGFSNKLTIVNTDEDITWSSSNTNVASVNSNGKVTGKKAGTAVITARLASGAYGQCTVTVKKNVYSQKKTSVSFVPYGKSIMQIYNAAYKNNNLVIKARFLNNLGRKTYRLKNVKVTIKNANGKVIGTYSVKKLAAKVNAGKAKNFTFKIKKAKLKLKATQDLTKITTSVSGKAVSKT